MNKESTIPNILTILVPDNKVKKIIKDDEIFSKNNVNYIYIENTGSTITKFMILFLSYGILIVLE
jgi:hypothetical protein